MQDEKVMNVAPNACFETDEDMTKGTLEIALPGVKKEDIDLKINEDGYTLSATRGDIKYVASESFCCPVVPEKVKAKYENGLLQIELPFKNPMENAVSIKVE